MSSSLVLRHLSYKIKSIDAMTYEILLRKKNPKKRTKRILPLNNSFLIQLFFTEVKFIDFLHAGF